MSKDFLPILPTCPKCQEHALARDMWDDDPNHETYYCQYCGWEGKAEEFSEFTQWSMR